MNDGPPQGAWHPFSAAAIAKLLADAKFPWWIAGGYAMELAAGRPLREHGDVDVLVLRRDQGAVRRLLADWDCWAAKPAGHFWKWHFDEFLPALVHDIWCREHPAGPWRFQVMLDEADGAQWQSRRDAQVNRPIAELGLLTDKGIPYLAPEIQLYYKAKEPRPIDEIDFDAVLPTMSSDQRAWLKYAILRTYRDEHPWLARLA